MNTRLTYTLTLLLFVAPVPADTLDTSKLKGLGDTHYQLFESETLGHPLHIYVRIPDSAAQNPQRIYPIIYLLDGGINFPLLSAYYHYLRLGEEVPEMILVGISYGSDRFEEGNYRASDFTAAASDRDWWGDAPKFQGALEGDLFPLIETAYPANPTQRILFGQSLGGQFVLYAALTRPDLYFGLIASNPALHRNLDFFMRWRGDTEMPIDATRLFVSEAEFNDDRFKLPALEWINYWSAAERSRPFTLQVFMPPGESHFSGVSSAFRQGLLWLFPSVPATP